MVAVRVLRGPDRRHRAQRVHGGGEGTLEHHALPRETVDVRRGRARIPVRTEVVGASGVEDDEEDVRGPERGPQAIHAPPLLLGRRRAGAAGVGAGESHDARRAPQAPRETLAGGPRGPYVQPDADDVARLRAQRDAHLLRRARLGAEDGGPQLLLLARLRFFRDAEGRGGAGRARARVERGPEAQLAGGGHADRVAHHARSDLDESGDAVRPRDRKRPRRVAAEQVLEAGIGGVADDEAVERGRELPPVRVPRLVRRRGRGREDEAQAVVARALRLRGEREAVTVAGVVEGQSRDGRPVEPHLRRLALHALVGREVHDREARARRRGPEEGQLRLALGPHERIALRGRGLAIEAVRLMRLGGRGAEEQHLPRRPALRVGQALGEVVGDLAGGARTAESGGGGEGSQRQPGRRAQGHPPRRYLTFVPGATSESNVHRTARPSTEAASTMPLDSTPISLAGFRFATSTIFLPINASGS